MSRLWSTLRVGSWTEREQVATWFQRSYPKKVIIDTQRDGQRQSRTPQFSALQDALTTTGQWHELTISSFPPEDLASQIAFQTAAPMNMLRVLHVEAGCLNSLYFTHLLDLLPTEGPITELRLYSPFAITYLLQPQRFPVLHKLTVLIVNGRGICEPLTLLPAFTQLQIFEVDHLLLPWYEPNANLPLLCTLQKLQLKGCSVQWMAGREFQCLEECAIFFPHHSMAWKQHRVHLPSCVKLTYHGYPMTAVEYLYVPQMKVMGLGSNDCMEQRVYQHLQHLCTLNQTIFNLTTLHLTLQCSEQVFMKVLEYLGALQELVLSTAHHSSSWQSFLESLCAKPSTTDWPGWDGWDEWDEWGQRKEWSQSTQWDPWHQWCSTQAWHANVLPYLKYLGIQCPKGCSRSACLGDSSLFRFVAWTRTQSRPPLEHLKVWEGRGTTEDIVLDYITSGYLEKHLGTSDKKHDYAIIRGMATRSLVMEAFDPPFMCQLHLTALFRQLQALTIFTELGVEILILPDLEQIKRLKIQCGTIPAYPLNFELPLVHTLQWLDIDFSTISWMLGRTFKALEDCSFSELMRETADVLVHNELQVNLPACRSLKWAGGYGTFCHSVSCPNIQFLQWGPSEHDYTLLGAAPKLLPDLLLNSYLLQELEVALSHYFGLDSLLHLIFRDLLEQGVWKTIRSVNMKVYCDVAWTGRQFFDQMVRDQQDYKKGWREFVVGKDITNFSFVTLSALM